MESFTIILALVMLALQVALIGFVIRRDKKLRDAHRVELEACEQRVRNLCEAYDE